MDVPADVDFATVEVLTFDCYGTLIDWEAGIVGSLREVLGSRIENVADDQLLEAYAAREAAIEAGPWRPYREVLATSLASVCLAHGVRPTDRQTTDFGTSVAGWPPFPDSADALARLAARYELGVITNCDDALFAVSNERLGRPFRWIVTAEQVRSHKPDPRHFATALERIGRPADRILHVAQSLYHDHVPARQLGLRTCWVNRRHGRPGFGATPPASATPDLVVPDMATLADLALP